MRIACDHSFIDLPAGSRVFDLAQKLDLRDPHLAIAAAVNGTVRDLSYRLDEGDRVAFLHFEDAEGKGVFWHTSAHVLAQAILRLYPEAKPTIGPPIAKGFYYDFADLQISEGDFPNIEGEVKKILAENWKPELYRFRDKREALEAFSSNPYKVELIEGFDEKSPITAYRQGEFFDLCRGPHLFDLKRIRAFKLLKVSGAYWRGDSKNAMLTRIYGISFPSRKMLEDHLRLLDEIRKRDHRVVGVQLDLFSFHEEAPGMPFIHPLGMVVWENLIDYWKGVHKKRGYSLIRTPQLMSRFLWERSGHWENYRENMFTCRLKDAREFAIKPMNCPGCLLFYRSRSHSYRDFPLRVAELGHVHRQEPSGALTGLFRVQSFHQDDAHIFMRPSDVKREILEVLDLVEEIYKTFGLSYSLELSTRPEVSIGCDGDWEMTTQALVEALDTRGLPYTVNEGDGAFYGPKIDLHVHDALDRSWQCGTVQLDMSLPQKFHLEYKGSDGKPHRPVMMHRAIFGSIERFFAILIEHFGGKFPLWMSPRPIQILPISERHIDYARRIARGVEAAGFSHELISTDDSFGKKVRDAQILRVNYILVVGDREASNGTVALRTRDNALHGEVGLERFLENLTLERDERRLVSIYHKEAGRAI